MPVNPTSKANAISKTPLEASFFVSISVKDQRMPRYQFDTIYSGPYDYPSELGVGICLSGRPTCAKTFCELLMEFSCNPAASLRIYEQLSRGESKLTTVSAGLNFNAIAAALTGLGVTLNIVPPDAPADQRIDAAALFLYRGKTVDLSTFTPSDRERVAEVRHALTQGMQVHQLQLGPYAGA